MGKTTIPVRPSKPRKTPKLPATSGGSAPTTETSRGGNRGSSSGSGGYSSRGSGGGGRSSGGGGSSSYASAQKKRDKKAGQAQLDRAKALDAQADALLKAINVSFGMARDQNLSDVSKALESQFTLLKEGAASRALSFLDAAKNTEVATASTAETGLSNLVRERQDSMTAVLEQGAGETDMAKALLMSARNWHANASESNRSYFDSISGVNASIVDMNLDTQTQLANAHTSAETERDRIWGDFYTAKANAQLNLGNVRQEQAQAYSDAHALGANIPGKKKKRIKRVQHLAEDAWDDAARTQRKSYEQEKLPDWIANYQGQEQIKAKVSNTNLGAAVTVDVGGKASGATLRKWEK